MRNATPRHTQGGATLLVVLIMLVLLTLFAISALNTSSTNLRVVGNAQAKAEAFKATQQAMETIISSQAFINTPSNAVLAPCNALNTICTDVQGKMTTSTAEYTTRFTPDPKCVAVTAIKMAELDLANAAPDSDDVACAASAGQGSSGVAGAATGNSLCANVVWEITAETTSASSGASVGAVQGIGMRVEQDKAAASC